MRRGVRLRTRSTKPDFYMRGGKYESGRICQRSRQSFARLVIWAVCDRLPKAYLGKSYNSKKYRAQGEFAD